MPLLTNQCKIQVKFLLATSFSLLPNLTLMNTMKKTRDNYHILTMERKEFSGVTVAKPTPILTCNLLKEVRKRNATSVALRMKFPLTTNLHSMSLGRGWTRTNVRNYCMELMSSKHLKPISKELLANQLTYSQSM